MQPEINQDVKINIKPKEIENKIYSCTCCGKKWKVQQNHFSKTQSPLYKSNNGYMTVCNNCRDQYYYGVVDLYSGNEEKAVERMCSLFDWFFEEQALSASRQNGDRSRIGHYIAKTNLPQTQKRGTTYLDTIKLLSEQEASEVINSIEDIKESKNTKLKSLKFFGSGFPDDDYPFLQAQFDDWTTRHECKTKAQEEVFKRLCFKQLEILKATRKCENTRDLDKTYQDLLATANIQPKQTNMDALAENRSFGQLIQIWENEKPISDPDPEFQDVDGIGRYVSIFFLGHLAKMVGITNKFSRMYDEEMNKYTVEKPEYEEDSEALFDAIFGRHAEKSESGDSDD